MTVTPCRPCGSASCPPSPNEPPSMITSRWLRSTGSGVGSPPTIRPAGQFVGQQLLEVAQVCPRRSTGAGRWAGRTGSARCGAHLSQSQAANPAPSGAQRDAELGRRVPGDGLQHHRGRHPAGGDRVALHPDPGERPQRQRDRQRADGALGAQQPPQGDRRQDVDVVASGWPRRGCWVCPVSSRARAWSPSPRRTVPKSESAGRRSHNRLVRISDCRPRGSGCNQNNASRLVRGRGPGLAPDLREVPEVVPPFAGDPAGRSPPSRPADRRPWPASKRRTAPRPRAGCRCRPR